jgi:ribonuclease R
MHNFGKLVNTMVSEQQLLEFMRDTAYKPMTYNEMEKHFQITNGDDFREFLKLLNKLEQTGIVVRTRNERYGVPERMNLIRGKLQAHAKGFGFLLPEDKTQPDVYIHANDLRGAMNNDIILVRITLKGAAGGKLEGEVVRVVTRANSQVVGVFQDNNTYAFVLPDDKRMVRDIFIPKHAYLGAVDGQKVVVKIVNYPEGSAAAEGEVIEVLGHKDDPGVDIISVIRKFQLPETFSEEVILEADAVPDTIREDELIGRRDLRGKRIVTIDGEDAKDLDDAVNVEKLPNGNYLLGVHIADVSYYVQENSALDREAYMRGCSVYLVDRVIPMLPHRLSNGICSLNPKVDRLTMSCEMEIDPNGTVVNHEVFTSVIKTSERMTYTNVRKILQGEEPETLTRYDYIKDDFFLMEELALKLRNRRMSRGAIDFDFQEAKIKVDENCKPIAIEKRERSIAESIIEEFMLKANETVAEHFNLLKVPFLYRIHEDPDSEKLLHFMEFITNFGYVVKGMTGNRVQPRVLQNLLTEIKGKKEETVISTVLLRSMKQARYDAESTGHFGLAAEYYSHFTSPIRRYPDLVIHRVMREVLGAAVQADIRPAADEPESGSFKSEKQTEGKVAEGKLIDGKKKTGKVKAVKAAIGGKLSDKRIEYLAERMVDIARQSSERERVAVEAERETDALKKAEFMLDKVGEEFEGIISSVTSFGMFVELDNTVEGLIRLSDLTDDYYNHQAAQHALIGERTSKVYRIGDEVKVRVARVSIADHTIDFEMVDMKPRGERSARVGDRPRGAGGRGGSGGEQRASRWGGLGAGRSGDGAGGRRKRGGGEGSGAARGSGKRGARAGEPVGGGAATGESRRGTSTSTSSIVPGQGVAVGGPRAGAGASGGKPSKRGKKPFYKGVASSGSKRKK